MYIRIRFQIESDPLNMALLKSVIATENVKCHHIKVKIFQHLYTAIFLFLKRKQISASIDGTTFYAREANQQKL